ncbi:uncharacterized protein LOC119995666 [Tripterygium wilfordii]|uniref:uncharacterized protein LOC119995666 n=1 Tax=Tripterygium wilfordii TaxID=458696 RepID=UPI0018F84907|nr:uncharacterized protein LOC119995666 [Tripterygium wilfordii]
MSVEKQRNCEIGTPPLVEYNVVMETQLSMREHRLKRTIVLSVIVLSGTLVTADNESLIAKTCNQTDYPQDCTSNLDSDPRSAHAKDIKELARISLEILASKVNNTASAFQKALVGERESYEEWSYVMVCTYGYNSSRVNMTNSVRLVEGDKYQDAYKEVEAVKSETTHCMSFPLSEPNLVDINTKLFRFLVDAMAVVRLLF